MQSTLKDMHLGRTKMDRAVGKNKLYIRTPSGGVDSFSRASSLLYVPGGLFDCFVFVLLLFC